jgi:poly-gamma-glutamate synthase PgsB/CapB
MRTELLALLFAVLAFLVCLFLERFLLDRRLESIPLRIAVTGTRGKSTVVRLLASILRADGRAVLAKTTGTVPRYLLPGGKEVEVPRRGVPSIIEQKGLVRRAADLGAECIVAEIMSIHPENHRIEARRLLRPHLVVLTNVRRDHTDAMGETENEIAAVLALGFAPAATIFVPRGETRPAFVRMAEEARGRLIEVGGDTADTASRSAVAVSGAAEDAASRATDAACRPADAASGVAEPDTRQHQLDAADFPDNLDLAWAVGRHLGIPEEAIARGIRDAEPDAGAARVWEYRSDAPAKTCYLVSGFAANDPQSTLQLMARVKRSLPGCPERFAGLLTLRPDRGDRTWQWIEALRSGELGGFDPLYVTGAHAHAMRRHLPELRPLRGTRPEELMSEILADIEDGSVIFGCGNYVGTGQLLADYWERTGRPHGL